MRAARQLNDSTAALLERPEVAVPATYQVVVECGDEDLEKNLKVLDRLEEVDDVDTVEHNMAL